MKKCFIPYGVKFSKEKLFTFKNLISPGTFHHLCFEGLIPLLGIRL